MSDKQRTATWEGFLPKRTVVMAKKKTKKAPAKRTSPSPQAGVDSLEKIARDLKGCVRCRLHKERNHIVVGDGSPKAKLVFVGEGPGAQEDLKGLPFVGRAGQLLDKMIGAIGLSRSDVYICNVVKCRPPGNRNPEPDEIEKCSPFLFRQLDHLQPKVVVALGKFAAQTLLQTDERISKLRGNFFDYRGTKLIPTYHPAFLLRNPSAKKEVWTDLKKVAKELGLKIPTKSAKAGSS